MVRMVSVDPKRFKFSFASTRSRLAIPFDGLLHFCTESQTLLLQSADADHCGRITGIGRLPIPGHPFFVVPFDPGTLLKGADVNHRVGCGNVAYARIGRHPIPSHSLLEILFDSVSVAVQSADADHCGCIW